MCELKPEIKSDHCLTHRKSISNCLMVSIKFCLSLRNYLLHEITSLLSSADVRNAWRHTSSLRTLSYKDILIVEIYLPFVFIFTFTHNLRNNPKYRSKQ